MNRGEEMQELTQVFNYQSKEVRTVIKDGEPWFVAKDVCDILEIKNPSDAMSRLDEDEKNTIVLNEGIGNPERSIVSESGLYNLILGSRKPEAKQFKRWITHEVIPSIRKTGTYSAQPKTAIEALQQTVKVLTEHETRIEKLENTMTIDYTQQEIIRELCNATVTKVLGGKDSNAYKLVAKKAFAEFWRHYKHRLMVNSYKNTPTVDFDKAREFTLSWKPSQELELMIIGANVQRPV